MVRINTKRKIKYMKNIKIAIIAILLNIFSQASAENTESLYEKIDLFSEVLEKVNS